MKSFFRSLFGNVTKKDASEKQKELDPESQKVTKSILARLSPTTETIVDSHTHDLGQGDVKFVMKHLADMGWRGPGYGNNQIYGGTDHRAFSPNASRAAYFEGRIIGGTAYWIRVKCVAPSFFECVKIYKPFQSDWNEN